MQHDLMEHMHERCVINGSQGVDPEEFGSLRSRWVQNNLHEIYGYLVRELSETMALLKNKPWRDHDSPVDREGFIEEVVDSLHFFIEFCIVAGITPEDLYTGYLAKSQVNHTRQETDY